MDVFLDTYFEDEGESYDPTTVELNNASEHEIYVVFKNSIQRLKTDGYTPTRMEVWDKNDNAKRPYKEYIPEDILNYFNVNLKDCKSIW